MLRRSMSMFGALAFVEGFDMHAGRSIPLAPTTVTLCVVLAAFAIATVVCTAMIYACLKFLAEWHSPLTVINYINAFRPIVAPDNIQLTPLDPRLPFIAQSQC